MTGEEQSCGVGGMEMTVTYQSNVRSFCLFVFDSQDRTMGLCAELFPQPFLRFVLRQDFTS